jgi:ABC-type dipeptide/oligopeptide/nickel transport system permease subunit
VSAGPFLWPTRGARLQSLRRPGVTGVVSVILGAIVLVGLLAPLIAPYDPDSIDLTNSLAGPHGNHYLGLDGSGRDIFSRLVYGTRTSLGGPAIVVALSTVISRTWDVLLAFPSLFLAILIVATFGRGFVPAVIAISICYIPFLARTVRGLTLVERSKPYVSAYRLQGFGATRILGGHVLPNISGAVMAQVTLNFGYALLDLTALSFIGLGVRPPTADWGSMLAEGKSTILTTVNPVIWPCVAIIVSVVCVNLAGDAAASRIQRGRR